ncbi:MAG: hypothetical protein JO040_14100 [Gemmatimonadetes bacterium]|nr:hypothetical protein [Gemmatimonadota bacterium]
MTRITFDRRGAAVLFGALALAACDGSDNPFKPELGFIAGTKENQQIGVVVNSTEHALTLFQLGDPSQTRQVSLGSSSLITPVGLSIRGTRAAVPLGNAASVAIVDLEGQKIERFFILPGGNLTGSAWADDRSGLVANTVADYVGRFSLDQAGDTVKARVQVAPAPTEIVMAGDRAMVVSGNLDDNYNYIGNGIVTALDPATLKVLGTVTTGGKNSASAALGPDGLLYVLNTEDYVKESTVTIIDPKTLQATATVGGFGTGAGKITIDRSGLAYVSGFFTGTLVWNTRTRQFVRGTDNPVCAKTTSGACRGAFDAQADENGMLYQVFFGSRDYAPRVFVYRPGSFQLADSLSAGQGPSSIEIRKF